MQLVYSLCIGGSEKVAVEITSNLDASAFRSHVCALDLDGELAQDLASNGIPSHVMHRRGLEWGIFRRLYRLFKQSGIDVVHTHHFTQLFYAAIPARLAGARLIHTEHEFFSYTQSTTARALIRPLLRLCDRMTAVGPEVRNYFVQTIGIPEHRVTVVPNGVAVQAFDYDRGTARQELGVGREEFVIGTIGRLEPEKDQKTLLDVFRLIRAKHPNVRLIIAGDGSMAAELRAHAERVGVADATSFLGYRRDIARLLAAMDIFVLTSVREGLPISLIEAMAARRPVVASNIGSIRDLVQEDRTGLLAPAQDTAAFAAAIERLMRAPDLRQRLVEAGRDSVEASFSLPAVIGAYETLYRNAAGKRHVRH
jgi:glycosyltransferase involved in cell wall biosynthesis